MKFFKIMALCVLLGLQNLVLFGLEAPEMEQLPEIGLTEEKIAAKDAALKQLNAYLKMPSSQRTLQKIMITERALQILTSYEMSGGVLTGREKTLVSIIEGALPGDKARLPGGARIKAIPTTRGAMSTRIAQRAITVKRPTIGATRTRVVRRRPTGVRPIVTRYGAERKPIRQLPRTRGRIQAPMVVPISESAKEFKDRIAYFFGGSLKNFFVGSNLNRAEFNTVLQVLEFDRQIANISHNNTYKFIIETIDNNKNSEITFEQKQMLKNFLSEAPVFKGVLFFS